MLDLLAMTPEESELDDGELDRIIDEIFADRKKDFGRPPVEF